MATSTSPLARAAATALLLAFWEGSSEISSVAAVSNGQSLPAPSGNVVYVSTEAELQTAAAGVASGTTIVIAPGTYRLTSTVNLKGPVTNVAIRGATDNAADVVLIGRGMTESNVDGVPHGIFVTGAQGVTIANLTIRDVFGNAINLNTGTEAPWIYNVRMADAGQQFIKAYGDGNGGGVDDAIVEYSVMEYTVTGSDARAGGVEVVTGSRWTVRNNLFRNISAPTGQLAAPAILMWQGSRDTTIEGNTFINNQREIALGLEDRTPDDHQGGIVRNNFIYRDSMVGGSSAIQVADSPNTQVLHNTILASGTSASVIEYRFAGSAGVVIRNNLLDGQITARDGATGTVADNYTTATTAMFVNAAAGDLHLVGGASEAIDHVGVLSGAPNDIDGDTRPQGGAADYGADEYAGAQVLTSTQSSSSTSTTSSGTTSGDSTSVTTGSALPPPWRAADIGKPLWPGSETWSSGRFTVKGGGADIGGSADQFRFDYRMLDGDGEIVARVESLDRTNVWAKAGVMIRDELTAGAKYAAALVTAEKGLLFQRRIANGAMTTQSGGGAGRAPYWLKLTRRGQTFTAYASADGSDWTTIGTESVYLNRLAYVGLAVTSKSSRTLTTAIFTDVTMTPAPVTPNQPPRVSITAPTTGAAYTAPCNVVVTAAASDPDGTVAKVDFYDGASLIASALRSPYSVTWSNPPAGKHTLKAVAQDDTGGSATSASVDITVSANQSPTVSLTAPMNNASFTAPAIITLAANASDADGTISAVDFYAGSTLIASDASSPYSATWTNVAAGSYTLTAVARDNSSGITTSAPIAITVTAPLNQPPRVSLTAPSSGATYTIPATITLTADASDPDGTIAKVEFYAGSTLVGSASSSPYSLIWTGAAASAYTLSAKAFDNSGAATISSGVNITVTAPSTLPPEWQTQDIGFPAVAGAANYSSSTFTVSGAGTDVGGTADQFRFVDQPFNGDGEVAACIASLDFVDSWTKAGVMFRETLTADSRYAFTLLSAGWGVAFQHRLDPGVASTQSSAAPGVAPHCVRLVRKGSVFTAYQSVDGASWTLMGSQTISMGASAYVGLAVTSHNATKAATAVFNNVSVRATAPNQPPVVSLTAPATGATFTAPANVTVSATASDVDGTVTKVDFYAGSTLIGSDSTSPYSVTWSSALAGTYQLTAKAWDDTGASTTSGAVSITVKAANQPPTVSLTAPSNGATYTAPASVTVSAAASDPDGTIAKVNFYAGSTLIGTDTTSPYSATWSNAPVGTYVLTAVAWDNSGASTTSAAASVTIKANQAPTVSLTAPTNGATFAAPATITLTATATDSDGTVATVDFYAGSSLLGSDTSSPYSFTWSSVAAGSYTLTAIARDNGGASTTSSPVAITVASVVSLPGYVAFTASLDHDTNVTYYTVEFFAAGANPSTATPVRTQNIGKPTPVNGTITADVAATVQALPAGSYFATVSATGPGGTSRSSPSATFVR